MRNCLGMEAFIREPAPPARMRKPTLAKPVKGCESVGLADWCRGDKVLMRVDAGRAAGWNAWQRGEAPSRSIRNEASDIMVGLKELNERCV